MKTAAELRQLVIRIDHRSYPAYKDTKGMYQFPGYLLSIDHVQGDLFASPSRVSIPVSYTHLDVYKRQVKNVPSIDIQVFITIHHFAGFCKQWGGRNVRMYALLCGKVVV